MKAQVKYTLNNNDELSVLYEATTDKPTVVNLTNHSYFNLSADFNKPKQVGNEIDENDQQLIYGNGYDHCWVLNHNSIEQTPVASVYHSKTGRLLEVVTEKPGVQFYTGNFLDKALSSTGTKDFSNRSGLCLETQYFPDSPNHKNFPSIILERGKKYKSKTTFKFSIK